MASCIEDRTAEKVSPRIGDPSIKYSIGNVRRPRGGAFSSFQVISGSWPGQDARRVKGHQGNGMLIGNRFNVNQHQNAGQNSFFKRSVNTRNTILMSRINQFTLPVRSLLGHPPSGPQTAIRTVLSAASRYFCLLLIHLRYLLFADWRAASGGSVYKDLVLI